MGAIYRAKLTHFYALSKPITEIFPHSRNFTKNAYLYGMKYFATVLLALAAVSAAGAAPRVAEVSEPAMRVYLPDPEIASGKAVVCCPGGGYAMKAMAHEGYDWAEYFTDRGIALAVVDYRLPDHSPARVMGDIDRAFEVMADSAAVWGFSPDSIGIMGSSAGGHLAATMSTHPEARCHPAFQLLFYPVISLDSAITHAGTRHNLLPTDATDADARRFSADLNVSASTPPAFVVHCGDDDIVPVENALRYYSALQRAGVNASMLIYPRGGHGWGYSGNFERRALLLDEIDTWLKGL